VKKHIHILGASGSGTTTIAKALRDELGYAHFDSDDYFWIPTEPPFTTKRPVDERVELLKNDVEKADKWILSGSNCGWGDFLMDSYDLVIFLYVPVDTRMKRLVRREMQRYPIERISLGGDMYGSHKAFIEWAAAYETGGMEMRSLALHNEWLKQLKCPVIRIEGEQTTEERIEIAMNEIL
jgi:adenylate kinase family enzyme